MPSPHKGYASAIYVPKEDATLAVQEPCAEPVTEDLINSLRKLELPELSEPPAATDTWFTDEMAAAHSLRLNLVQLTLSSASIALPYARWAQEQEAREYLAGHHPRSLRARLVELSDLLAEGAITAEEHRQARKAALGI